GVFLGTGALLLLLRSLGLRWLRARKSHAAETFQDVVHTPSFLWAFCLSLMIALRVSPLPDKYATIANGVLQLALLVSMIIALDRLILRIVLRSLGQTGNPMAQTGLIRAMVGIGVFGIGGLF